ncbi:MAG: glutamate 5-kinase [Gammaproteobacteria bacterium]
MNKQDKCWVVKVGSALLTRDGAGLRTDLIAAWVDQIMQLSGQGYQFVIVSSGAVAEGLARLGQRQRPYTVYELQAVAAVGQMGLVQAWESCFQQHKVHTAQILLTHDDISNRQRYLNARSTLRTLLGLGVIPVVNENDSVATDEIRLGDNDMLAGLVCNLVEAERLVILTDQQGLFDKHPGENEQCQLIEQGQAGDKSLEQYAGAGGALGRGGMLTKLQAAGVAAQSGTETVITKGTDKDVLLQLADGKQQGTYLAASDTPLLARKQWLAGQHRVQGQVSVDAGAERVLREQGKSLLAVGVTAVQGEFQRGEVVSCVNADGVEIARGLINYSAAETAKIMGKASGDIQSLLGYVNEPELMHRDNMLIRG